MPYLWNAAILYNSVTVVSYFHFFYILISCFAIYLLLLFISLKTNVCDQKNINHKLVILSLTWTKSYVWVAFYFIQIMGGGGYITQNQFGILFRSIYCKECLGNKTFLINDQLSLSCWHNVTYNNTCILITDGYRSFLCWVPFVHAYCAYHL